MVSSHCGLWHIQHALVNTDQGYGLWMLIKFVSNFNQGLVYFKHNQHNCVMYNYLSQRIFPVKKNKRHTHKWHDLRKIHCMHNLPLLTRFLLLFTQSTLLNDAYAMSSETHAAELFFFPHNDMLTVAAAPASLAHIPSAC